jgi:predicted RNA-binding Zn ribbon-like protein
VHWESVEGVRVPQRAGGHPALDLCNTLAGWADPPADRSEWLPGYDELAVWSELAGLLGGVPAATLRRAATRDPEGAAAVVAEVRSLRHHLRAAILDPHHSRGLRPVGDVAQRAAARATLTAGDPPLWRLPVDLDLPLLAAGRVGAEFLTQGRLGDVRACPGPGCGWLFLDARGRRRWCSMAWCGNRAKVRAHAARARLEGGRG